MSSVPTASVRRPTPIHYAAYGIVVVVWAIIGFICWIPLLFRATATLASGILVHTLTNSNAAHLSHGFDAAVTFYARGFFLVRTAFLEPIPVTESKPVAWESMIARFILELVWTAAFWGSVVFATIHLFGPRPAIPQIGAYLTSVRFFPGGTTVPAAEERQYGTTFSTRSVQYIYVDLAFEHAPTGSATAVPITCRYIFPDGTDHSSSYGGTYQPDSYLSGGHYVSGIGWREAGNYPPGDYTAECAIEGGRTIRGKFTITA